MRLFWIAAISVVLSVGPGLRARTDYQQLPEADLRAAQQLAIQFTKGFVQTADVAPVIRDHFAKDFIERYKKSKSEMVGDAGAPHLYFVPGLEYNSRLLSEASTEDWRRFYTAANNFLFFGAISAIKSSNNAGGINAKQLYPGPVIDLLNTNPTLSNMIVRKGTSRPIGSVAEMQKVTSILEQAVSLLRERNKGQAPLNLDEQELMKAMNEEEFFKPKIVAADDKLFGLPRGTQVVFINTPILFRLMLVKANNGRWEIIWADPTTDG